MEDTKKKVLVAMSGGVDSTAAAVMLMEQGYEVEGATMILTESMRNASEAAKRACERIGIRHMVFEAQELFEETIRKKFAEAYFCANTPNPCIDCNKFIKFGYFANRAFELGFDYIATGHYCRTIKDEHGVHLMTGNLLKDQTYFLCEIDPKVLEKTIFPIGLTEKSKIREIVGDTVDLEHSNAKDSQDICFVTNTYLDEIKKYQGAMDKEKARAFEKGSFVLGDGEVLGEHDGVVKYTVGQRHGMGIAYSEPLFVLGTNPEKREVRVGTADELFSERLICGPINVLNEHSFEDARNGLRLKAKIRYGKKLADAVIESTNEAGDSVVKLEPKMRAVTPGQRIVFYDGEECLGGARILEACREIK